MKKNTVDTTDGMMKDYDSGDYICVHRKEDKWAKGAFSVELMMLGDVSYRLIHNKHKDILEDYLYNNNVPIEMYVPYFFEEWQPHKKFIERYKKHARYRHFPKVEPTSIKEVLKKVQDGVVSPSVGEFLINARLKDKE